MPKKEVDNEGSGNAKRPQGAGEDMEQNPLHEVFLDELADLYSAEKQLLKALPRMAKAAKSEELREAFEQHLSETEEQVNRLEQAVEALGEKMKRKTCKAMEGLLEEAKEMMDDQKDSPALDAVLIAAAQKVEHYEIASYGTVCTWAELMGHDEALDLLQETLDEEKNTDERLTEIAETVANLEAEQEEAEETD
jgi:ferritin-like metal-binding protein YciE